MLMKLAPHCAAVACASSVLPQPAPMSRQAAKLHDVGGLPQRESSTMVAGGRLLYGSLVATHRCKKWGRCVSRWFLSGEASCLSIPFWFRKLCYKVLSPW